MHMFLVVLLGAVYYIHGWISGPVLETTVRPGDNITLYCDLQKSLGVHIVWLRNSCHEADLSLVLEMKIDSYTKRLHPLGSFPHFQFVENISSKSYDLLIMNATDSDEGLYYCGTKEGRVEDKEHISPTIVYRYGNVTRVRINCSKSHQPETPLDCGVCWTLLFSLCPAFALLSSLLSSLMVYHLSIKKAKKPQVEERNLDTGGQTEPNQGDDVCYAALDIRQASHRSKKRKTQSSDFSTYSAINTCRM